LLCRAVCWAVCRARLHIRGGGPPGGGLTLSRRLGRAASNWSLSLRLGVARKDLQRRQTARQQNCPPHAQHRHG